MIEDYAEHVFIAVLVFLTCVFPCASIHNFSYAGQMIIGDIVSRLVRAIRALRVVLGWAYVVCGGWELFAF